MTRVCKCVYVRGMCVYWCVCACVWCVSVRTCAYHCGCLRVHLRARAPACARACVYVRVRPHVRVCLCLCICARMRGYACKCGVARVRVCAWAWVWVRVCRTKDVGSGNFDKSFVLAVNNRDIAYTFLLVAKVSENKLSTCDLDAPPPSFTLVK